MSKVKNVVYGYSVISIVKGRVTIGKPGPDESNSTNNMSIDQFKEKYGSYPQIDQKIDFL